MYSNDRVPTHPGKSWNLRKEFSRPGKSWKVTVVMENGGIPPIGHGIFQQKDDQFRSLTIKLVGSPFFVNVM